LVYDPFLGSGTTLIACEQTGRVCYGMEIDPVYVDVIVRRWEVFTGKKAVLDGNESHTQSS
jgi:DNA modification methylase